MKKPTANQLAVMKKIDAIQKEGYRLMAVGFSADERRCAIGLSKAGLVNLARTSETIEGEAAISEAWGLTGDGRKIVAKAKRALEYGRCLALNGIGLTLANDIVLYDAWISDWAVRHGWSTTEEGLVARLAGRSLRIRLMATVIVLEEEKAGKWSALRRVTRKALRDLRIGDACTGRSRMDLWNVVPCHLGLSEIMESYAASLPTKHAGNLHHLYFISRIAARSDIAVSDGDRAAWKAKMHERWPAHFDAA